jgi:uncharacterized coiled-coil protein SlyX
MSLILSSDCLLSQLAPHGSSQDTLEGVMLPSPSSDGHSLVSFDELDLSMTPSGNAEDIAYLESLLSPEHAGVGSEFLNIVDPEDIVPTSDYHSSANVVQDPPEDNGLLTPSMTLPEDTKPSMEELRSTRSSKRSGKRRKQEAASPIESEDEYQPSDDNISKRVHRSGMSSKDPKRNAVMAKLNREKKKAYVNDLEERIAQLESDKAAALKQVAQQTVAVSRAQAEIARLQAAVKSSPAIAEVLRALGNCNALSFGQGQPADTIPVQLNLSLKL